MTGRRGLWGPGFSALRGAGPALGAWVPIGAAEVSAVQRRKDPPRGRGGRSGAHGLPWPASRRLENQWEGWPGSGGAAGVSAEDQMEASCRPSASTA